MINHNKTVIPYKCKIPKIIGY